MIKAEWTNKDSLDLQPTCNQLATTDGDLISRADAIEAVAKLCVDGYKAKVDGYFIPLTDALINTLSALPSAEAKGDLVSRQWLLEVYGDYIGDNGEPKYHVPLEVVRQTIKDAPSAEAVQGWKTGKPTEQGKYMVTVDSFGHKRIDLFYYGKPMMPNRKVRGNCWYRSDDEWGDVVYDDTDILAWMPLPTPYKCGEDE